MHLSNLKRDVPDSCSALTLSGAMEARVASKVRPRMRMEGSADASTCCNSCRPPLPTKSWYPASNQNVLSMQTNSVLYIPYEHGVQGNAPAGSAAELVNVELASAATPVSWSFKADSNKPATC